MSLDRKRTALAALSSALWEDLAQTLDDDRPAAPPYGASARGGEARDEEW